MKKTTTLGRRRLSATLAVSTLALSGMVITPGVQAVPSADGLMDVEIIHTNPSTDGRYDVGDVMTYDITLRNISDQAHAYRYVSSNLSGEVDRCKWRDVAPQQTKTDCTGLAIHVVTEEDITSGGFTPQISYEAMAPLYEGEPFPPQTTRGNVSVITGRRSAINDPSDSTTPPVVHPPATAATEPNVDPRLPAEFTTAAVMARNNGVNYYRIPSITSAPNGDLLISYDERPLTGWDASGGDSPNPNSIVQRRSTDNGRTWGTPTYINRGSKESRATRVGYSDPSYVVDWETGAIFNFHVKSYDVGFQGSRAGTDPNNRSAIHAAVSVSRDNGYTWESRVITPDITASDSWISRFAASGQGIQLKYGAHKGRLVQQYTVKLADGTYQALSVYSDDHGATWRAGTPVGVGMDENKVVELSDGTLLLNSRDSHNGGYRKITRSTDGGQTWSEVTQDHNLPDPTNNAQIIRAYPSAPQGSPQAKILLFTNAATTSGRTHGTIKMSCDDGRSWSSAKTYSEGHVGYTTIAVQSDGSIGLLTEEQGNTISYHRFTLGWLEGVCASLSGDKVNLKTTDATGTVEVTVANHTEMPLSGDITLDLPTGVSAAPVSVSNVAAGSSQTVRIPISIAEGSLFQNDYKVPVRFTSAQGSSQGVIYLAVTDPTQITREKLSIADFSSQNTGGGENTPATNVIDGDLTTFWHSQWSGGTAQAPHHVTLKINGRHDLTRLVYVPRPGSINGVARDYEVLVASSVDGVCPAESTAYRQGARGEITAREVTGIPLSDAQGVDCVRFVIKTDQGTGNFGSAAEIILSGLPTGETPAPEPTPTPEPSPTPEPTPTPEPSPTPEPTPTPQKCEVSTTGNVFVINSWMRNLADNVLSLENGEVFVGDFDGDGFDTFAVRNGADIAFYDQCGKPSGSMTFEGLSGGRMLAGDLNGDGKDDLILHRGKTFFVKYDASVSGAADTSFTYGREGDQAFVGNFDGEEGDGITVRRGNTFYVRQIAGGGNADEVFSYGRSGDVAFAGDFDGDGQDTLSVRRGNVALVNNRLEGGNAAAAFIFGRASDSVLVGDWDADGVDTMAMLRR